MEIICRNVFPFCMALPVPRRVAVARQLLLLLLLLLLLHACAADPVPPGSSIFHATAWVFCMCPRAGAVANGARVSGTLCVRTGRSAYWGALPVCAADRALEKMPGGRRREWLDD